MFSYDNLLTREMIQINNFERRLYAFESYSFDKYSSLKLINVQLKNYVNNGLISADKQVLRDFSFELEQEIESLSDIRYSIDKDAEFMDHVNYTLGFIKRFKVYFPKAKVAELNRSANPWYRFKQYMRMHFSYSTQQG